MYPVLIVALFGVAIAVERTIVIVLRSRVSGRVFIDRLVQLASAEKLEEAIRLCPRSKSVLPDIGLLILRSRAHDDDDADLDPVPAAALKAVIPRRTQRLRYLPT